MSTVVTGIAEFNGMPTAARLLERGDTVIGIDNFNDYFLVALKTARIAALESMGTGRLSVHRVDIGEDGALPSAFATSDFDRIVPSQRSPACVIRSITLPPMFARTLQDTSTSSNSRATTAWRKWSMRRLRRSMAQTGRCRFG